MRESGRFRKKWYGGKNGNFSKFFPSTLNSFFSTTSFSESLVPERFWRWKANKEGKEGQLMKWINNPRGGRLTHLSLLLRVTLLIVHIVDKSIHLPARLYYSSTAVVSVPIQAWAGIWRTVKTPFWGTTPSVIGSIPAMAERRGKWLVCIKMRSGHFCRLCHYLNMVHFSAFFG